MNTKYSHYSHYAPLLINGECVETVPNFRFLGTHISADHLDPQHQSPNEEGSPAAAEPSSLGRKSPTALCPPWMTKPDPIASGKLGQSQETPYIPSITWCPLDGASVPRPYRLQIANTHTLSHAHTEPRTHLCTLHAQLSVLHNAQF